MKTAIAVDIHGCSKVFVVDETSSKPVISQACDAIGTWGEDLRQVVVLDGISPDEIRNLGGVVLVGVDPAKVENHGPFCHDY